MPTIGRHDTQATCKAISHPQAVGYHHSLPYFSELNSRLLLVQHVGTEPVLIDLLRTFQKLQPHRVSEGCQHFTSVYGVTYPLAYCNFTLKLNYQV